MFRLLDVFYDKTRNISNNCIIDHFKINRKTTKRKKKFNSFLSKPFLKPLETKINIYI